MKTAIDTKTGQPIHADGTAAQMPLLGGKPFLHILPRLWLPYPGLDLARHPDCVGLESIAIPALNIEIDGREFSASRPFPNFNYVVLGKDRRMGWMLPLEQALPDRLEIEYRYTIVGNFRTAMGGGYMEIFHIQTLHVQRSEIGADCYSTEHCVPAFVCPGEYERVFAEKRRHEVIDYGHEPADKDGYYAESWSLMTKQDLKPLHNRYVFSLEFENHKPFHAKKQALALTRHKKAHQRNGRLEAPFDLLFRAAQFAQQPDEESLPEEHIALRALCEWWNSHPDVPAILQRARTCQILVRIENNDEYQDLDLQVPPFSITRFHPAIAECCARIGAHFLIVFLQGQEALQEDEHGGTTHFLVNKDSYETCGICKAEYRPGWFTLRALATLERNHPALMSHYLKGD